MIGKIDSSIREATVVGAGISGLLIAHHLKKNGYRVTVFDAAPRAGGLIETRNTPFGPAETAAHSLMVETPLRDLFAELRVELSPVNEDSRARYIYRGGKMRKMPLTLRETASTLFHFFSKPSHPIDPASATLADWARSFLGEAALHYLLAPFVTGVYAATPEELKLALAFPGLVPEDPKRSLFWNLFVGKRKSPKNERPRMMAPKGGMEAVVKSLTRALGPDLHTGVRIETLPEVPNLVLALPPPELARLLRSSDPEAALALEKVEASPLITITAFAHAKDFSKGPPRGVGVLIPRNEGLRLLGVLFNSSSFPDRGANPDVVSLTLMLGGTTDPEALELSDRDISDLITQELGNLFGLRTAPLHLEITRWKAAIPLYSESLDLARKALLRGFCASKGRVVFTNYSKEVSIRGMINALQQTLSPL
jgi:oxygen-dependent protoporphyrinogen oxidase